jgi:RNA polymerase sigma factor (sigma-70 family)
VGQVRLTRGPNDRTREEFASRAASTTAADLRGGARADPSVRVLVMRTGLRALRPAQRDSGADDGSTVVANGGMVAEVVTGELSASFESLFRREYRSVARAVYLILYDHGAAEEVTQDAFAKLLQRWDRISEYERPDAWVRHIAVRMAIRRARRELRRPSIESRHHHAAAHDVPDIDLARAIGELSPHQRAAVVLFYWDDRSVSEIATILGSSESTVKQHLHRARSQLRALLDTDTTHER